MIEERKKQIDYIRRRIKLWEIVIEKKIYDKLISKKEIIEYIKYSKEEIKQLEKEIEYIKGEKNDKYSRDIQKFLFY